MANPNLPQFGDWNSAGNVPITQCFDNIRKAKKDRKFINPNDPQENPEAFHDGNIRPNQTPPRAQFRDDDIHTNQPPRTQQNDYPARGQFAPPPRRPQFAQTPPRERQNPNDIPQKANFKSEGNASPLRPQFQLTPANRPEFSSQPTSRDPPDVNSAIPPRTPGKSPMRTPAAGGAKKASIPQFGGWANNPDEPVGYTVIFSQARDGRREDKQAAPAIPNPQRTPEQYSHNHEDTGKSSKNWFSSFLKKLKGVFTGR